MPLSDATVSRLAAPPSRREDVDRARKLAVDMRAHRQDALELYRPYGDQEKFHLSAASERILIGGNRSGKSSASFIELASAALKKPLRDSKGNLMPHRYPTNRPLVIWVIGYGEKNITTPIFRLLFKKGAFKIIKDLKTGEMRAWNPRDPEDMAREAECEESPPYIPKSAIDPKGWAWKNKAARVFTQCTLKNGTMIYAFTSNADPKQGDPVDLILIDEDIQFPKHVAEWQARLSDNKGRLIWSAFPHGDNAALFQMSERAEKQKGLEKPDVAKWVLKFSTNPFMPADEIRKRTAGWSDAERRARDHGEFVLDLVQMFPTFSKGMHCVNTENPILTIDKMLQQNGWQPPLNWTRYLVLDPGHSHPAVLFAAVPPPTLFRPDEANDYIVLYNELFVRNIDAYTLAQLAGEKMSGQNFETFLIDGHAGRQTPMGFGHTIKQQYSMAFEQFKLLSNTTDNGFIDGSDDICGRNSIIRSWLLQRPDGPPKIRVIADCCPHLLAEFRDYKKHISQDEKTDKQVDKDNHLLSGLGYLVSYNPQYVTPDLSKGTFSPGYTAYLKIEERFGGKKDDSIRLGPWAA